MLGWMTGYGVRVDVTRATYYVATDVASEKLCRGLLGVVAFSSLGENHAAGMDGWMREFNVTFA